MLLLHFIKIRNPWFKSYWEKAKSRVNDDALLVWDAAGFRVLTCVSTKCLWEREGHLVVAVGLVLHETTPPHPGSDPGGPGSGSASGTAHSQSPPCLSWAERVQSRCLGLGDPTPCPHRGCASRPGALAGCSHSLSPLPSLTPATGTGVMLRACPVTSALGTLPLSLGSPRVPDQGSKSCWSTGRETGRAVLSGHVCRAWGPAGGTAGADASSTPDPHSLLCSFSSKAQPEASVRPWGSKWNRSKLFSQNTKALLSLHCIFYYYFSRAVWAGAAWHECRNRQEDPAVSLWRQTVRNMQKCVNKTSHHFNTSKTEATVIIVCRLLWLF